LADVALLRPDPAANGGVTEHGHAVGCTPASHQPMKTNLQYRRSFQCAPRPVDGGSARCDAVAPRLARFTGNATNVAHLARSTLQRRQHRRDGVQRRPWFRTFLVFESPRWCRP
jgi:hypothetical protein